ncbi:hypothetical protein ACTS9T_17965 [Empedobacter falsenii]|jgi:hypothetical protein|uniref:hypothetical protein n=1 Tax=Empedobacter stercoris TaxID=1628248 RepID=UPI00166259B1|nr:hypothetical protein [Empedobacter stercoris]MCA4810613.1 hypothetical protein [Empedobacter stercoris]QNT15721.1 hypothetical protein HNV03_13515 [Empedobacter stercoris]
MYKTRIEEICRNIEWNLDKFLETNDKDYQTNITNYLTNEDVFGKIINISETAKKLYNNDYIKDNYKETVLSIINQIKESIL